MKKEDFIKLGISEEQAIRCEEEIGKYVLKTKYDELESERNSLRNIIKDRDKQLHELKNSKVNIDELKSEIDRLQNENKNVLKESESKIKELKTDNAISLALTDSKAKNSRAVRALLDLDKIELLEDGSLKGLDDQIKHLVESEDSKFLFDINNKSRNDFKGIEPVNKPTTIKGSDRNVSLQDAIRTNIENMYNN